MEESKLLKLCEEVEFNVERYALNSIRSDPRKFPPSRWPSLLIFFNT